MPHLHEILAAAVADWRQNGYESSDYPAIAEILDWCQEPSSGEIRFLRTPQLRALETYWYLRLVRGTPHVFDLYQQLFPKPKQLLEALGLADDAIKEVVLDEGLDRLWQRIRSDDEFVRDMQLEAVRETLTLAYPSYILALAMGAGKTVLIGAIIATEFAMAMEYTEGPFVQNALVFAPGKTIIESLKELIALPYSRILPPRMHSAFEATVKMTFTRDGDRDLPIIRGSLFNLVVTNTEKIRIQKEAVRKGDLGALFDQSLEDQAKSEVANLRLQAIASLPHLAIFSDEAHHTYGQSLNAELKKVRKTVDYLAARTNVYAVINTTGTPYFERQPLRDVVIWYGLAQGIKDGILKDISGNILAYDFHGDARAYVNEVVTDFFNEYGETRLPNGAAAKLAIYFPQTADLEQLKPTIEAALVGMGVSPDVVLVNTSDSQLTSQADIEAFKRLNDADAPHRVILLVNKGTEGWNCPSLFACALARRLRTSNNFILQAATRCLRQIPGNEKRARIYLSTENRAVLDRQLQETYGESLADLDRTSREFVRDRLVLRKPNIAPLVVNQIQKRIERRVPSTDAPLRLSRPRGSEPALTRVALSAVEETSAANLLQEIADTVEIESPLDGVDAYAAALQLTNSYRLDFWTVYDEIRRLYAREDVSRAHLSSLSRQIEAWQGDYAESDEQVQVTIELVKTAGFIKEEVPGGGHAYVADVAYPKENVGLLMSCDSAADNRAGLGFHYSPYNFDSQFERSFFEQVLRRLNQDAAEIDDIYFTGATTDPEKTDFRVDYKDEKGKWRRYTPDFLIRKKDSAGSPGLIVIVEIKDGRFREPVMDALTTGRANTIEGRKALAAKQWQKIDPNRIRFEIIFDKDGAIAADDVSRIVRILKEKSAQK